MSMDEIASGTVGFWVHIDIGDEHRVTYLISDLPNLTPDVE